MSNYSFYLFSKLFDVIIGHEYEYDLMFQDLSNLFFFYENSPHNNPNDGEYECMAKFFTDNLDWIKSQQYLLDIEEITNKLNN